MGFIVLALLAVGTSTTAYITLRSVTQRYEERTSRQAEDLIRAEHLRGSFSQACALARGYLVTRETSLLSTLDQVHAEFRGALSAMLKKAQRDPAQRHTLAKISLIELEYRRALERAMANVSGEERDAPGVAGHALIAPVSPVVPAGAPKVAAWDQELETLRASLNREINHLSEQLGTEIENGRAQTAEASRNALHGIAVLGSVAFLIVISLVMVLNRLLSTWRRAEDGLQRQQLAQKFLAEASGVLSRSLQITNVLRELARLFVPRIADFSAIYVTEQDGRKLKRLAVVCLDPGLDPVAESVLDQLALEGPSQRVVWRALKEGRPTVLSDLGWSAPGHSAELEKLSVRTLLLVPIQAGERLGGAILLGARSPGAFGEDDLALAGEIGRRAGYTIENARLYEKAQRAISVRDEFLSIASHELKTPLTSLYLQLQLLLRGVRGETTVAVSPENSALLLESCRSQSRRLGRLIDELLDLTRIRAGKLELKLEDVDLTAIVKDVVARLGSERMQSGSKFHLELQSGVLGRWDRTRLEQVVTNLISNAIKYGAGRPITVSLERDGTREVARLSVRDQGLGISPEHQERIFERFERAINAKHISGLGLGLYIVKQIVGALGGEISLRSDVGQGSTFIVELPVQGPTSTAAISPDLLQAAWAPGLARSLSSSESIEIASRP